MYFVQLRIAPQNPKTPAMEIKNYEFNNKTNQNFSLSSIFINLGSKVVLECTQVFDLVFYNQGCVRSKHQLYMVA